MKIDVTFDELRDIQDAVYQESMRWSAMANDSGCPIERSVQKDYSELLEKLLKIES